jgi:hypothetical protein
MLRLKKEKKMHYELKVQNASFVKYIGNSETENLIFVQDASLTNYYLTATELSLIKEVTKQAKVTDVCGSSEYIFQAILAK